MAVAAFWRSSGFYKNDMSRDAPHKKRTELAVESNCESKRGRGQRKLHSHITLGDGVTGNTLGSGPSNQGSIPCPPGFFLI